MEPKKDLFEKIDRKVLEMIEMLDDSDEARKIGEAVASLYCKIEHLRRISTA